MDDIQSIMATSSKIDPEIVEVTTSSPKLDAAGSQQENACSNSKTESKVVPYELEYEAQHHQFHPRAFVDSLYNIMFNKTEESLKKLGDELAKNHSHVVSDKEFKEMKAEIRNSMITWMNTKFHHVEPYVVEELLAIPPNVLLAEDQAQEDERLKSIDRDELDAEIRDLENQVATMAFMKTQMDKEKQIIKTVRDQQTAQKELLERALDIVQDLSTEYDDDEQVKNMINGMDR